MIIDRWRNKIKSKYPLVLAYKFFKMKTAAKKLLFTPL